MKGAAAVSESKEVESKDVEGALLEAATKQPTGEESSMSESTNGDEPLLPTLQALWGEDYSGHPMLLNAAMERAVAGEHEGVEYRHLMLLHGVVQRGEKDGLVEDLIGLIDDSTAPLDERVEEFLEKLRHSLDEIIAYPNAMLRSNILYFSLRAQKHVRGIFPFSYRGWDTQPSGRSIVESISLGNAVSAGIDELFYSYPRMVLLDGIHALGSKLSRGDELPLSPPQLSIEEREAVVKLTQQALLRWSSRRDEDPLFLALWEHHSTMTWGQLCELAILAWEYNVEWAVAAMEW